MPSLGSQRIGHYLATEQQRQQQHGKYIFNFIRNYQTVFRSGCIILHSYQQNMRASVALHPSQHLIFSVKIIFAILIDVDGIQL